MASDPKSLVERFYAEVWNKADEGVAREILHPDFRFRGSLGSERIGVDGFIEYMHSVHAALAEYTCTIEGLVAKSGQVAARMKFSGIHRAPFFGIEATGCHVSWAGAAFFEVAEGRIRSLWVLGDIDGLKRQLGAADGAVFGD